MGPLSPGTRGNAKPCGDDVGAAGAARNVSLPPPVSVQGAGGSHGAFWGMGHPMDIRLGAHERCPLCVQDSSGSSVLLQVLLGRKRGLFPFPIGLGLC